MASTPDEQVSCQALTPVFALLGKRWSGLIISTLLAGPARFSEMARLVPGVSERMLSGRLTELLHAGLIEREVIEGPPVATRYRLTTRGEGLRPALHELELWAKKYLVGGPEGPDFPGPDRPTAATPVVGRP